MSKCERTLWVDGSSEYKPNEGILGGSLRGSNIPTDNTDNSPPTKSTTSAYVGRETQTHILAPSRHLVAHDHGLLACAWVKSWFPAYVVGHNCFCSGEGVLDKRHHHVTSLE